MSDACASDAQRAPSGERKKGGGRRKGSRKNNKLRGGKEETSRQQGEEKEKRCLKRESRQKASPRVKGWGKELLLLSLRGRRRLGGRQAHEGKKRPGKNLLVSLRTDRLPSWRLSVEPIGKSLIELFAALPRPVVGLEG